MLHIVCTKSLKETEHAVSLIGHRWEKTSHHNKFTEVECVVTHESRMCDPGGVCGWGELGPHVILLLWVCSHVSSNVFLRNSSNAITDATALCQTHVALTRYCSRWRSVSGVNSEDMGMISPFLMIMALKG